MKTVNTKKAKDFERDGKNLTDVSVADVKNSVELDDGDLQLVGDEATPGNNKVYGTNASGEKGWKNDPASGSGDMLASTYDPAGGARQVAFNDELFDGSYNSLSDVPTEFTPASHTHAISDVTNLQTELNGKAPTNHTHTASEVTDFQTAVSANSDVTANTAKRSYPQADEDKLATIDENANNYTHPNHTGDVTSDGDGATTIANEAVTKAKLSTAVQSSLDDADSAVQPADLEDYATLTEKTDTTGSTLTPDAGARINRYHVTALDENATLEAPTGTAERGDTLAIQITATDDITITYNAIYVEGIVESETEVDDGETLFAVYTYDGSEWVLSGQFKK